MDFSIFSLFSGLGGLGVVAGILLLLKLKDYAIYISLFIAGIVSVYFAWSTLVGLFGVMLSDLIELLVENWGFVVVGGICLLIWGITRKK